MRFRLLLALALSVVLTVVSSLRASAGLQMPLYPPSYGFTFTNAFGNLTFQDPVAIVSPPGEINRLFIVERAGRIAVITNLINPTRSVFLDISDRVLSEDEQGLLGLAFHPGFATNQLFYT